jgi:hypothetical protein
MPNCIVCQNPNCDREPGFGDFARYDCPRCGAFVITGSADAELPNKLAEKPIRASLMSHALRKMQRPGARPPSISSDELPSFWLQDRLPVPQHQADSLIVWVGDHQPTPFDFVEVNRPALAATIGLAISGHDDSALHG